MTLYRARKKALLGIEGTHSHSYTMLRQYAREILLSNRGSLAIIQSSRHNLSVNP